MNFASIAAAALMTLSASSFAGTSEGFYLGAGLGGYSGSHVEYDSAWGTTIRYGSDSNNIGVNLYTGYKFDIMGHGSIATEFSYNSNVGKYELANGAGNSFNAQFNNNWAVSVLPGYSFTKDTTGYVRVGYTQFTGKLSAPGGNVSHAYSGVMWGFGVDQAVTSHIAARLEYKILNMTDWTSGGPVWTGTNIKPRSTGVDASVRYGF